MKVLVVSARLTKQLAARRDLLPEDIQVISPEKGTDEELIKLARDVDVIVSTRLSADVAKAAKHLKLLQKTGAGVDAMPFDALNKDVFVANTSGANPVPLAEGTVALMLALAKRIVQRHNQFQRGRTGEPSVELRNKKVGIIGFGHIGVEIARMLQAFEMRILALKRHPYQDLKNQLNIEFLGGPNDLNFLLRESDFVIVIVPLTPETRGMIGERELRLMKPTAFIVNVARAAIIQEEPLFRALKDGWIAGAALDVWWTPHWWDSIWSPSESTASKFPFWELSNVIATPHNIGSTDTPSEANIRIITENINRIAQGKPPINQVNKKLQY